MDVVSPLIYKKLDFSIFNQVQNESCEKSTDEEEVTKILYDSISKKIIQFADGFIRIFNKDLSTIKKNVKLSLAVRRIKLVSVEKQLRYMLVILDNQLLIINLRTESVFHILSLEGNQLLGSFFISYFHIHHAYYNEDIRFCLVYANKIVFYKLTFEYNEQLSEIRNHKVDNIRNFYYNPEFLVLLIRKGEHDFEFYNLISDKFYLKPHAFEMPNKSLEKKPSSFSKFFGFFSKKEEKAVEVLATEKVNKESLYKKTHYFLETIYKKLYFICVNYEDKEIQIYHVTSLINLKRSYSINFDPSQIITLQVIDNLVLIHNFDRLDTIMIDIKSEANDKKIFNNFPMSNFEIHRGNQEKFSDLIKTSIVFNTEKEEVELKIDYNYIETKSMLEYENKSFYEQNIVIDGCMMIDKNSNDIYLIYFDPSIYYENSDVKYESVFNLIRRKNSKDVIINALFDLVKTKYSVKTINVIYTKIVTNLYKTLYDSSLKDNNPLETIMRMNPHDIVNPKQYFVIKRKTIVKQSDIYYQLFKQLESSINVDFDFVFKSLVYFIMALVKINIPVQPVLQSILISIVKKVKNFSILNIFLQYHLLPDSMEFALFLIEISNKDNDYGHDLFFKEGFQLGLDMLVRLKKFEEIFRILICNNKLYECLLYLKQNKIKVEYLSTETKKQLEKVIASNKSLVIDFLGLA